MKGSFILLTLVALGVCFNAEAQRYRNQSNLGSEEMVKFIAMKDGDVLEFNWEIKSTRDIKTIEIKKGNINAKSVEWETVKSITNEDEKYVDMLPNLGKVFYKLILTDAKGIASEYTPEFKLKKDETSASL